ncbi:hypothetical protein [Blastopirellula marina]|uniref:Uncharacterized protein n=1 Tax=Blastopirellula marina TaxID=124 RepID=A0A2S8GFM3_9BACT|nr:hypothetical protein [Blastopirellula marina]PQO43239.1 hypothetical protein C5Y93_26435 [Blastopirellula marina]
MSVLPEAMTKLSETARSPEATTDLINQAVQGVEEAITGAGVEDLNQALTIAQDILADERVHRLVTQKVTELTQKLVEAGGDPLLTGWTLLMLLGESLTGSIQYCQTVMADAIGSGRVTPAEGEPLVMTNELAELYLQAMMQRDPYVAWLFYNWPSYSFAAVAHIERAPELRTQHPENTQLLLNASKKLDQIFGGPASYLTTELEKNNAS